jgi:positive regulator of sigma E activity
MEEDMKEEWGISILYGLLVYVILAIFLGVVNYIIPILSDDTIILICVIFGIVTAALMKIRDYA